MAKTKKYTTSAILRAIRGDPDASPPVIPKDEKGQIDEIAATFVNDERLSSHGHIPTIALRLSCSNQTIRNYCNERERLPEYRVLNGLLKQVRQDIRDNDDVVYDVIKDMAAIDQVKHFGLSSLIEELINGLDNPGVNPNTVLRGLKKAIYGNTWGDLTNGALEIQAAIEQEKEVGLIESVYIRHELKTDAEKMAHLLIKAGDGPMTKFILERLDKENYAARTEMTGADGENLYDDDARKKLGELAEILDDMGKNPSEAIIDAVNVMKLKLAEYKDKGKDNTHSTERGVTDE